MTIIRPENSESMPLRISRHRVSTLVIRFVGLLVLAVVAMTLAWGH